MRVEILINYPREVSNEVGDLEIYCKAHWCYVGFVKIIGDCLDARQNYIEFGVSPTEVRSIARLCSNERITGKFFSGSLSSAASKPSRSSDSANGPNSPPEHTHSNNPQ